MIATAKLLCFADRQALIRAAADLVATEIACRLRTAPSCRLALAGGGTPRPLYRQLAGGARLPSIDWGRLEVFWGDERYVPHDDPASNWRMAQETLLDHVPVPRANIHPVDTTLEPSEAARRYEETLGDQPLDLTILGMGSDGHTASLFPDSCAEPTNRRVIVTESPIAPHRRISLSFRALNDSKTVVFVVSGQDKAACVARVWQQEGDEGPWLPAARVRPHSGKLYWLVDQSAAGALYENRGIKDPTSWQKTS